MAVATIADPVAEASSTIFPIGIVIPTYNRVDVLMTCLSHLERQTTLEFEVVIVDDGSSDSTQERVRQFQEKTPLRLQYVRQTNSGPARARNLGVTLLRAPICLFIGDDILASPDLVAKHLELHLQRPELQVAGLGVTQWSQTGQDVTRFMQWLDSSGVQFAYGDLLSGVQPDWKYFYTCNLSVKTELLRQHKFNEEFPHAALEDSELGYRIQSQHGLEIVFMANAVAHHLHPTSFRAACTRMLKVGSTAQILYRLWPELEPAGPTGFRKVFYGTLLRNRWLIRALTVISDPLTRVWCPNPVMRVTLMAHYFLGNSRSRL